MTPHRSSSRSPAPAARSPRSPTSPSRMRSADTRSSAPAARADGRGHAPAGANPELRGAESAHGVVVQGRRGAEPHRARAQVVETAQGVLDGTLARGNEIVERNGERVDGEVAAPEITLEVGRAEIHDVYLRSPPPSSRGGHETCGASPVVEDEKGSVESVGERARGGESARRHGHVDVRGGLPAQEVPERPTHEVGGPRRPEDGVKRFESESTDDKTRGIRRRRHGPTTHRPGQPATSQSRRARPARASRPRLASVSLPSSPKSRAMRLGVEYTAPPR